MQKFILPVGGLILLAIITAIALVIETGIWSDKDSGRVVATGARCIGNGLDRGRRYTHTDDKENIKRYVSTPTTPFVCIVRKKDGADCAIEKTR